jgi:adenosine deaminase
VDPHQLRRAPKVLLHDHLDGGLRPQTVLELAREVGHELPADDVEGLGAWFHQGDKGVDLPRYLEAFGHTVAVMQTPEAIERVARECAEDLDLDGVVYAEVRFAPELATAGGLSVGEVLEAVAAGFAAGPATITMRTLVCAMRQEDRSEEVFEAAAAARHLGVVGIDLAGPEVGFPASRHARAIERAREDGLRVTLHAGEADGPAAIADALDQGAERLGHGVRILDDIAPDGTPGPVAGRVLTGAIPLELCLTSNVHTGVAPAVADHPFDRLRALGFAVTLNTDNRLMSGVSASSELGLAADTFDYDVDDLRALTLTAIGAAFVDDSEIPVLRDLIARGYAALVP